MDRSTVVQDISQQVTCGICLEHFKIPKTVIPCLHNFCEVCLQDMIESTAQSKVGRPSEPGVFAIFTFSCPTCRGQVEFPVRSQSPWNRKQIARDAVKLEFKTNFQIENQLDIINQKIEKGCPQHQGEVRMWFCKVCHQVICQFCVQEDHNSGKHDVTLLNVIAKQKRKELSSHKEVVCNRLCQIEVSCLRIESQLEDIYGAKNKYEDQKKKVTDEIMAVHKELDSLKSKIHDHGKDFDVLLTSNEMRILEVYQEVLQDVDNNKTQINELEMRILDTDSELVEQSSDSMLMTFGDPAAAALPKSPPIPKIEIPQPPEIPLDILQKGMSQIKGILENIARNLKLSPVAAAVPDHSNQTPLGTLHQDSSTNEKNIDEKDDHFQEEEVTTDESQNREEEEVTTDESQNREEEEVTTDESQNREEEEVTTDESQNREEEEREDENDEACTCQNDNESDENTRYEEEGGIDQEEEEEDEEYSSEDQELEEGREEIEADQNQDEDKDDVESPWHSCHSSPVPSSPPEEQYLHETPPPSASASSVTQRTPLGTDPSCDMNKQEASSSPALTPSPALQGTITPGQMLTPPQIMYAQQSNMQSGQSVYMPIQTNQRMNTSSGMPMRNTSQTQQIGQPQGVFYQPPMTGPLSIPSARPPQSAQYMMQPHTQSAQSMMPPQMYAPRQGAIYRPQAIYNPPIIGPSFAASSQQGPPYSQSAQCMMQPQTNLVTKAKRNAHTNDKKIFTRKYAPSQQISQIQYQPFQQPTVPRFYQGLPPASASTGGFPQTQFYRQPGPMMTGVQQTLPRLPRSESTDSKDVDVPITAHMLAQASQSEQKQMLGERLYPIIHKTHKNLAGKITGMLLDLDNAELLHLLESPDALATRLDEAIEVLKFNNGEDEVV